MGKYLQDQVINNIINKKKAAIFYSSGIGNAILMVPLLEKLNTSGFNITIFIDSPYLDKEFIQFNNIKFDQLFDLRYERSIFFLFRFFKQFDYIFLDYSSSSVKNILIGSYISKRVFVHRKNRLPIPNVRFLYEKPYTHAAVLNIQLFDQKYGEQDFCIDQIRLNIDDPQKPQLILEIVDEGKIPVFVQPSSANLTAQYKNWPIEYWIELLIYLSNVYTKFKFILIGDENEIIIGEKIKTKLSTNCINLIGKTELVDACKILYSSKLYLGLDSGFMHLAAAYGIPTFSIFGASSYHFVGYEKFDADHHKVIFNPLSCWPCHGFSQQNRTRVNNPKDCPDNICLKNKKPDEVAENFFRFYNSLE